jgi:serpin B
VLIASLLISQSCNKEDGIKIDPKNIKLTKTGEQLIEADNNFGFELFKKITVSESSTKNIMISPLSISLALAMTYNGADGTTKTAFEETLNLQGLSTDNINQSYKDLVEALVNVDDKVTISIANSIWYRMGFSVLDNFIKTNQKKYNAEVSELDFDNSNSVNIINNWVADNTNNKIEEIVDEISSETIMFLINAIYFYGEWTNKFEDNQTENRPFYISDNTETEVSTMSQKSSMNYLENADFKAVELTYGPGNYSMILMLPSESKTLNDIISQLNEENWNLWLNNFSMTENVNLYLPKFKFEYEKTLNEILCDLGLSIAFNASEANFSKINTDFQLFISKVKHKTFIEVDEKGTEAAAVTSVEMNLTSIENEGQEIFIYFDKPFLFVIREVTTNAILFIGKVENPNQ